MIFCKQCGKGFEQPTVFCSDCGAKLTEDGYWGCPIPEAPLGADRKRKALHNFARLYWKKFGEIPTYQQASTELAALVSLFKIVQKFPDDLYYREEKRRKERELFPDLMDTINNNRDEPSSSLT